MIPVLVAFTVVILLLLTAWGLDRRDLLRELRLTQDRLYGAWKDGAVIPPRPTEAPEMQLPPLPDGLQALVTEWESPDSQLAVEATIRRMLAQGQTAAQIFNHYAAERLREA